MFAFKGSHGWPYLALGWTMLRRTAFHSKAVLGHLALSDQYIAHPTQTFRLDVSARSSFKVKRMKRSILVDAELRQVECN